MRFHRIRKFYQSIEPLHLLLGSVALFVVLFFIFQYNSSPKTNLEVNYHDFPAEKKEKIKKKQEIARLGENEPGARLAARVTEANGLANGILQSCLYRHFVLNKGVPPTLAELLTEFQNSELKPPYIQRISETGGFLSERGSYYLRYSPRPLLISILASGGEVNKDGPVFVLRTPDSSAQSLTGQREGPTASLVSLFVAPEKNEGLIPAPFASMTDFQQAGWTVEALRLTDITPEKLEAVNRLLREDR